MGSPTAKDRSRAKPARRPSRPSTIADVAALAGVDPAVVSKVLNDDPKLSIRDSTRKRVEDAVQRLGYRPNLAARSLRTSRTSTLALLVPDWANPAYGEIVKGAEQAAASAGSSLLTASMSGVDDDFGRYLAQLGHGRVDGLLIAAGGIRGFREQDLEKTGLPWLCVNRTGPGKRRYVVLDDEAAAELAVDHLISLGHRELALLAGPRDSDSAVRRRKGYMRAIRRAGVDASRVVYGDYAPAGGADAMRRLLESPRRPTGVLAANVASAIGALHVAAQEGVRIPRDLSVVAVHDLVVGAYLDPPLTTIRMDLEGLGARAVDLLLSYDPNRSVTEILRGPIELIRRESTGRPRRRT